ncbi:MAG: hypothetical protein WDZ40_04415 [Candidatus Spechtbacterales bacterium]
MNKFRSNTVGILFFVILFSIITPHADALTLELNYPEIPTPTGSIDLNCLEIGLCDLSIALLLVVFYGASVWIAGILAFLALIFAGMSYIISGASPGARARANERFINVLWGLSILLLANAIIYTVNPQLITGFEDPLFPTASSGSTEYEEIYFTSEGLLIRGGSSGTGGTSGGGGGGGGTPSSCSSAEVVENGTNETYNHEGSSTAEIQNTVSQQLRAELSAGGLSTAQVEDYANYFFTTVIPCESTWVPHAENEGGTNCMAVGLYQLEDNRYGKQACRAEYHRWHHWQCETSHAVDRFFEIRNNRPGCSGWEYWECAKTRWTC